MSNINSVQLQNRELACRVNDEARRDPNSVYAGKFVGIANGKVVVVADDWDALAKQLRAIEPDPTKCCGIEASTDYDQVVEIWSTW